MFDLFSDPAKVAAQMEIIFSEFGFATWETLYSVILEALFAYLIGSQLPEFTAQLRQLAAYLRYLAEELNMILEVSETGGEV